MIHPDEYEEISRKAPPTLAPIVQHVTDPFCVCPDCHIAELEEYDTRRRATKDQKAAEAMAALRPNARGNMIPFRVKVISLLGAALGFLLCAEVRSLAGLTTILAALTIALPVPLLRRAAASYGRQREAERIKVRKQIESGHRLAVKEGLWWPEADGSISIGGKPITVDEEADQ